jgi:hypothetical protein
MRDQPSRRAIPAGPQAGGLIKGLLLILLSLILRRTGWVNGLLIFKGVTTPQQLS